MLSKLSIAAQLDENVHEKFLDGLANIIKTERETVTITEHVTTILSLTSTERTTETTVDYKTRTISSTVSLTNTHTSTFTTEVTKSLTFIETEFATKTETIPVRITVTESETANILLNLHLQTHTLPASTSLTTTFSVETVTNTISEVRTFYESIMNTKTSILIRSSNHRVMEYATTTESTTIIFETFYKQPRIKTVTSTTLVGSTSTVHTTETIFRKHQHYARIPGIHQW